MLGAVDGDPSLNQSYNQDLFASGSPDPSAPALVDVLVSPVVADHALTKVKLTESLARCQEYANKVVQYDQVRCYQFNLSPLPIKHNMLAQC